VTARFSCSTCCRSCASAPARPARTHFKGAFNEKTARSVRLARRAGTGDAGSGPGQGGARSRGDRAACRSTCCSGRRGCTCRNGSARAGTQQGRRRMDAHLDGVRADDERAGAGAFLWRNGAFEERALRADAGVRGVLADFGAVVRVRLQPRVHRGQRVLREL
jgi:hypothetical protein